MSLRDAFNRLGFPTGGAEFAAERLAARENFRIARDRHGRAALLIAHDASPSGGDTAVIELQHVAFWAAAECEITSSDGARTGIFAIVRWKSDPGVLEDLFLELLESWIETLGDSPSVRTIRSSFDRLAQVFAALAGPSSRDVMGLWGELLLIACAAQPDSLVRAWRVDADELYDFQSGLDLIEVKTTLGGTRRHDFSLAQLSPPSGARLVVASFILVADGVTMPVAELARIAKSRLSLADLRLRVDATVLATVGSAGRALDIDRFNAPASAAMLRFFDGAHIPCVPRNVPPEVSDVRFRVELDGLTPVSELTLIRLSAFHGACRPTARKDPWIV